MKTTIITMILAVGMLLRPQPTPTTAQALVADNATVAGTILQTGPQALKTTEMNKAVGGEQLTGCYQTRTADGDVYGTCCVDLWLFTVCVSVNESAVERLINSFF